MTLAVADVAVPALDLPPFWAANPVVLPGDMEAIQYTRARPRSKIMLTLVTIDDYGTGGLWLHSSASLRTKRGVQIPSWEDLKEVHQVVHRDRPVVQVLPPSAHWLSISECLHLFERLDAPTIPEVVWRQS